MRNTRVFCTFSLIAPVLFGCSNVKMAEPHFKKFGSAVSYEYFKAKIEHLLTSSSLNNMKTTSNFKLSYETESEQKVYNIDSYSYSIYSSTTCNLKYDSINERARADLTSKQYVKNHNKEMGLDDLQLKEGAKVDKSRLYAESFEGKYNVVNLDLGKVDSYPSTSSGLIEYSVPVAIFSLLMLNLPSSSSTKLMTYVKGDKVFTVVATDSYSSTSNSYYSEMTLQFIFGKTIRIMSKSLNVSESFLERTTNKNYEKLSIKKINHGISRISYKVNDQNDSYTII